MCRSWDKSKNQCLCGNCTVPTWKSLALWPRAFQALMMHFVEKWAISARALVLAIESDLLQASILSNHSAPKKTTSMPQFFSSLHKTKTTVFTIISATTEPKFYLFTALLNERDYLSGMCQGINHHTVSTDVYFTIARFNDPFQKALRYGLF